MKDYPVLYKRTKTGAIQSWLIELFYMENNTKIHIEITQGQLNGKKQTYDEYVTEGKANRTLLEQAELQAESRWNEQKDKGYKALSDLIRYNPADNIRLEAEGLDRFLENHLPIDSTDANGNLKPMKCTEINKAWKKVIYPCYVQRKLDGVRCFILYSEDEERWIALSSSGKSYDIAARYILAEITKSNIDKSLILDGELYKHGIPLQTLSGWARTQSMIEEQEQFEYHIFDIADKELYFGSRYFKVIQIRETLHITPRIQFVDTYIVPNKELIMSRHNDFVAEGYEGLIVRNTNLGYEFGRRSTNIFKMKDFKDEEYYIVDAQLGARGSEDMVFVCLLDKKTLKTFKANPIGTRAQKEEWVNNTHLWQNKLGTVRYLTKSLDGIPQGNPVLKAIRDYED